MTQFWHFFLLLVLHVVVIEVRNHRSAINYLPGGLIGPRIVSSWLPSVVGGCDDDLLDDSLVVERFAAYVGLEAMNIICGVVDNSTETISVIQLIRSGDCTILS